MVDYSKGWTVEYGQRRYRARHPDRERQRRRLERKPAADQVILGVVGATERQVAERDAVST
jgi:hypothetical protein